MAEDQQEVVPLRQILTAADLRTCRNIAVEQLPFRAKDLIEQIFVCRIVFVRCGGCSVLLNPRDFRGG